MQFNFDPVILNTLFSVLVLVVADVLLGVIGAASKGEFDVRKLPQFLQTGVLQFVGSLVVLALLAPVSPVLKGLFVASAAAVDAKFVANIKDKLVALVGYKPE
ncbi:MAG: hypothetical protein AB1760_00380 [Pseudomonadota bacterium]